MSPSVTAKSFYRNGPWAPFHRPYRRRFRGIQKAFCYFCLPERLTARPSAAPLSFEQKHFCAKLSFRRVMERRERPGKSWSAPAVAASLSGRGPSRRAPSPGPSRPWRLFDRSKVWRKDSDPETGSRGGRCRCRCGTEPKIHPLKLLTFRQPGISLKFKYFSKNGPFPASFSSFLSFQYSWQWIFNIIFCRWLDSNRGPL